MSARLSLRTLAVVSILVVVCFTITASAAPQKGKGGGKGKKEEPLALDLSMMNSAGKPINQILVAGGSPYISLFAYDNVAKTVALSWKIKALKGCRYYDSAWIGDGDNDGVDEVVGFCGMLSIYEIGSTGESEYFGGSFSGDSRASWLMMVGDVGGNPAPALGPNEVVLNLGDRVEVWRCDDIHGLSCGWFWGEEWGERGTVPFPRSLEIGNANNDPLNVNDIVVGTYSTGWNGDGSVRVYTSESGIDDWGIGKGSEPVLEYLGYPSPVQGKVAASVGAVAVDNVAGDEKKEIVATITKFGVTFGDSEYYLAIWEHTPVGFDYEYSLSALIPREQSSYLIDTGDFDKDVDDPSAEIVLAMNQGPDSRVEILKYDGETLTPWESVDTRAPIEALRVGDPDNDGFLELVVLVNVGSRKGYQLQIWEYAPSGFSKAATLEEVVGSRISIQ